MISPFSPIFLMQAGSGTNALDAATARIEHFKTEIIDYTAKNGFQILGAMVILIAGWIVVRWISNGFARMLDKQQMEPPVKLLLVRVVRLLLMIGVFVAALENAGFPILPLITGIGVAGVGVGLALQGVLSNLVAGLTIIFTKPFRVGEYIEIAGVQGQVIQIELFSTTLLHADTSRVVVPNRKIVGEILHNCGNIRQLHLVVGVAYNSELSQVVSVIREILAANSRVLKNPAPIIGVTTLADSSVNIAIKPWTNVPDYNAASAEIYQSILREFQARKIEIPFPQREVRLLDSGGGSTR